MKKHLVFAILCLAWNLGACTSKQSQSVVYVSVTAVDDMSAVTQLRASLSGAGVSAVELFPPVNSSTPISFTPAATFVLVIPRSHTGDISVSIDALDAASQRVGHGEGVGRLNVGERVDVSIALYRVDPNMGAGGTGGNGGTGGTATVPGSGTGGAIGGAATTGALSGAAGTTGAGGTVKPGGNTGLGGVAGAGGTTGVAGTTSTGSLSRSGGSPGGTTGTAGVIVAGGSTGVGGQGGVVTTGGSPGGTTAVRFHCGDGKVEQGEQCDCGTNPSSLPAGCVAVNGLFFGDGKGCSRTCSKEPLCRDNSGKNQACLPACGDGNLDQGEACDDGNGADGDGCSAGCTVEGGFACTPTAVQDTTTCQSGSGQCVQLPVIYRDFQGENESSGGHPDFLFFGTKYNGSKTSTTICIPQATGPAQGSDAVKRCWGFAAEELLNGKPQPGPTRTCDCKFSDWSISNSTRIPDGYTKAGNDSPLSDGMGDFMGHLAGSTVNTVSSAGPHTGVLFDYTSGTPGGPIWKGTVPSYKDASSFNQWFNDDDKVNKRYTGFLELQQSGSNILQHASRMRLAAGGFFPLDALNPSQKTLCNLWPYWNHGNGAPIWSTCAGDQYFFPPLAVQADCASGDMVDDGCWVRSTTGERHNYYFTFESHSTFTYDAATGLTLRLAATNDLFVFINGMLVMDLGSIHSLLPGTVTIKGNPGDAQVSEGGCLDSTGNMVGNQEGSTACSPTSGSATPATEMLDFRNRTVKLGLESGKMYELAIFGADRHPVNSELQIVATGLVKKRSVCSPK